MRRYVATVVLFILFGAVLSAYQRDDPYLSPWPQMTTRGNRECDRTVTASFGETVTFADLDALIGPRVERYEVVYGPHVRIEGTATGYIKTGPCLIVRDDPEFLRVRLDGHREWPEGVMGRRVVVEGCLSRTYYSWEASHLDPSKLTERQKQTTNVMRALPVGFIYSLRDARYQLLESEEP